jgi:hypothetical protein
MPYRSHVQQLLPLDTLDGEEEFVDRDVSDGTSESASESNSESSSSLSIEVVDEAGEIVWRAKRVERASRVALSYWVWITSRVW